MEDEIQHGQVEESEIRRDAALVLTRLSNVDDIQHEEDGEDLYRLYANRGRRGLYRGI